MENHVDTLMIFSRYLESFGHTVVSSRTMADALVSWPTARCDVLISDLRLPDGDGWELLTRLCLPRSIHAIAISGLGMAADRARSKASGFRHHLLKPFRLAEFDAALREAASEAAD